MALDFPNSPSNGDYYEGFVWDSTAGVWRIQKEIVGPNIDYFLVGGGGAGGRSYTNANYAGGGGGAGGLIQGTEQLALGAYNVRVGAGGAAASSTQSKGFNGQSSYFGPLIAVGGGGAGGYYGNPEISGEPGGSGGGCSAGWSGAVAGKAIPGQGFDGGGPQPSTGAGSGAGGGGAAGVGESATSGTYSLRAGGAGITSSITGSSVTYAVGGAGGRGDTTGGGNGASGAANTGTGGGGNRDAAAGNGGSGIVVVDIPDTVTVTGFSGLTYTSTAITGATRYIFTAGEGTVTLA